MPQDPSLTSSHESEAPLDGTHSLSEFPSLNLDAAVKGVEPEAIPFYLLRQSDKSPVILHLARSFAAAEEVVRDLTFLSGSSAKVFFFEPWDTLPFEYVSPHLEVTGRRRATLRKVKEFVKSGTPIILVTCIEALQQQYLPLIEKKSVTVSSRNEDLSRDALIAALLRAGYRSVALVQRPGEYSQRGNVLDFFPAHEPHPIRVEYLDEEIEKIKRFNPESQRSIGAVKSVTLLNLREYLHPSDASATSQWREWMNTLKDRGRALELPPRDIARVMHALTNDRALPARELVSLCASPELSSLFDELPENTIVTVDEAESLSERTSDLWQQINERADAAVRAGHLVPCPERVFLAPEELLTHLSNFEARSVHSLDSSGAEELTYSTKRVQHLLPARTKTGAPLKSLSPLIDRWRNSGLSVAIIAGSSSRTKRIHTELLSFSIDAPILSESPQRWLQHPMRQPIVIIQGALTGSTLLEQEQAVFLAEQDLFPQRSQSRRIKRAPSLKRILQSLGELHPGDYVVHEDHGIGIYEGLEHISRAEVSGDFLKIRYLDSTIYLPAPNILRMQKYSAAEGAAPRLDRLGSHRWARAKAKVRESVIALAGDLLSLYAARESASGWRYEPWGAEDERFAEEFPFTPTQDQDSAIQEVLGDMARPQPMDRLICGDVGFGKTEVAMRAAFKATQHARQVAVLVPTTILAEQHYKSFVARFAEFGVEVAAISRFYTPKQNKETLARVADGSVDIVIGTHKLLAPSVQFHELGLLIIDEEHRFGVKQKERLKRLKTEVDVLTMTATPIPRTLQMSISQLREMSVISTPPTDRKVIKTYVTERDEQTIKDAIQRELKRNGQVYFLHNKVMTIEVVTESLRQLVPEARFAVAHGQMSEDALERIMADFIQHKIDVLVSTTIIESGLDIPNANTMIVDQTHRLGLAQLYQIRGRVGRGTRQAYCYFLVPETRTLKKDAQRRLKALQNLDDLGQGFQVALRDLEIRGAGTLLGKQQSGAVASVGYEMYNKIIKEAVSVVTDSPIPLAERVDPEIKLPVDAYLPEPYVPDVAERVVLYQRLASMSDPEQADLLYEEISDRYGNMGGPALELFSIMKLRALLRICGILKLELRGETLLLHFHESAKIVPERYVALLQGNPARYAGGPKTLRIHQSERDDATTALFQEVYDLMKDLGAL